MGWNNLSIPKLQRLDTLNYQHLLVYKNVILSNTPLFPWRPSTKRFSSERMTLMWNTPLLYVIWNSRMIAYLGPHYTTLISQLTTGIGVHCPCVNLAAHFFGRYGFNFEYTVSKYNSVVDILIISRWNANTPGLTWTHTMFPNEWIVRSLAQVLTFLVSSYYRTNAESLGIAELSVNFDMWMNMQ